MSALGYGTKGGYPDSLGDYEMYNSLRYAVREGPVNMIDTSYAFRLGRSERVIAKFIENSISTRVFQRNEIVVTSKCGFAADDAIEKVKTQQQFLALSRAGLLKASDVAFDTYSLNPDWIRFQNTVSRMRLGLNTIDIYYIHNPFQNLGFFISPQQFELALQKAFQALEELRASNFIQYYGVASFSSLRANPELPKSNPMSRIYHLTKYLELAQKVGGENNGLKFIEVPLSFSLPEAFSLSKQKTNQNEVDTLSNICRERKVNLIGSMSLTNGRDVQKMRNVKSLGVLGGGASALQLVRSIPSEAIKCHLVGMNDISHVKENIEILKRRQLYPEEWEVFWDN